MIKAKNLRGLKDSKTLDLAFYEIGNAMIQEVRMGIIDAKASLALAQILQSLSEILNVVSFEEDLRADKVLETAKLLGRTFHDAAYVTLAKDNNEALVTDDGPLAKAAAKLGLRTYSAANLPSQG
jgi:predicted nucleic acid-binding protein